MSDNNEFIEQEIDSLFEDARQELDKVDENAKELTKELKKNIVVTLAKKLEGKIPTDTISIEIVNQLRGRVSERFVRECLDEKYKQKSRVKNAKKQKKKQQEYNLAAVTPLNQEVEVDAEDEEKNKILVQTDVDGRSYIQREDDKESSTTSNDSPTFTDKSFSQSSYQSQKEQEQFHEITSQLPVTSSSADKMIITEGASIELSNDNDEDIIPFEFPINRKDIQDYLSMVDEDEIWINGIVNMKTKEVIHYFGRQSQQNVAEKSSRNDTATAYKIGK